METGQLCVSRQKSLWEPFVQVKFWFILRLCNDSNVIAEVILPPLWPCEKYDEDYQCCYYGN